MLQQVQVLQTIIYSLDTRTHLSDMDSVPTHLTKQDDWPRMCKSAVPHNLTVAHRMRHVMRMAPDNPNFVKCAV